MKTNTKTTERGLLVDSNPISIPTISSTSLTSARVSPSINAMSQVTRQQVMVSIGTQTVDSVLTIEQKRKVIRTQLGALLHAVLCRVRDQLTGNVGATATVCPTKLCGLMTGTLNHLKTCESQYHCPHPYCLSSREILSHWKFCQKSDCPICSPYRKVVPDYITTVVQNPRWRGELLRRFQWLFAFFRSPSLRSVQQLHLQHARRSQSESVKKPTEE